MDGSDIPRPAFKARGFANLPDQGALVAYGEDRTPARDGAYTWHRAQVSEAHAIGAIVGGKLSVLSPSGKPLEFTYDRHEEHPSGDWTWVGTLAGGKPGEQAIITFGDKATFGTMAQPGAEPLRLTTKGGVAYVVETDVAAVVGISATRPRDPDYLVPPKRKPKAKSGMAAAQAESAPFTASNTVDVLVGYTAGFVANLGGQSQATTRLNFLAAVTNQAYLNSNVDAQIRLVHAMQVDYPDATSNETALEELTGFQAPSTETTPNPAFNALRAARDQYGADLVSLVRKFHTPENDSCGIAWLIGGDMSGYTQTDEFFGYSVVSDGTDQGTDGKTYFCRDETFGHELGHNLGSQHDKATASGNNSLSFGAYQYSFGYKTAADAGNFYTIMAYGESGQTRYRVFSNPDITFCGGFACGIPNEVDNARSLRNTIPIASTFRATVVALPTAAPRGDFDGDGKSDFFWTSAAAQMASRWFMNGPVRVGAAANFMGDSHHVVGLGDFDNNGRSDVLWSNNAGTQLVMWRMDSSGQVIGTIVGNYPAGWSVAGVGDLNGDGKADIFWRNSSLGQVSRWYMDGATRIGAAAESMSSGYTVAGFGDFDGNGKSDVLWRDNGNTQLVLWSTNASNQFVGSYVGSVPVGWSVAATADMNADGRTDIVWRNASLGQTSRWYMNGPAVVGGALDAMSTNYQIIATGDFDGDGRYDLLLRDNSNSSLVMWRPNNTGTYVGNYVDAIPSTWSVVNGTY